MTARPLMVLISLIYDYTIFCEYKKEPALNWNGFCVHFGDIDINSIKGRF